MSSDLDVARGVHAASATGDIAGVLAALSPDLHWTEAQGGPHGGVSIGPHAVLENVFMKLGSFKAPFAHVWKFRDGKAVSFQQYTDTALQPRPLQA